MEGAQTREDLSGATKMDELVYFYNNTVSGCKMGQPVEIKLSLLTT